jgi:hypothetical protein
MSLNFHLYTVQAESWNGLAESYPRFWACVHGFMDQKQVCSEPIEKLLYGDFNLLARKHHVRQREERSASFETELKRPFYPDVMFWMRVDRVIRVSMAESCIQSELCRHQAELRQTTAYRH